MEGIDRTRWAALSVLFLAGCGAPASAPRNPAGDPGFRLEVEGVGPVTVSGITRVAGGFVARIVHRGFGYRLESRSGVRTDDRGRIIRRARRSIAEAGAPPDAFLYRLTLEDHEDGPLHLWYERPGESAVMTRYRKPGGREDYVYLRRDHERLRELRIEDVDPRLVQDPGYNRERAAPLREFAGGGALFLRRNPDFRLMEGVVLHPRFQEALVIGAGGTGLRLQEPCPEWLKSTARLAVWACRGLYFPNPWIQAPAATACIAGTGVNLTCAMIETIELLEEEFGSPPEPEPGPEGGGEPGS